MTDLFGEWVPDAWLDRAFAYIALSSQHTFQILTKRPERMRPYFQQGAKQRIRRCAVDLGRLLNLAPEIYEPYETCEFDWPIANIWLGTSVENQKAADSRIPSLLATPASVRFLSCEPLLEFLDLSAYLPIEWSELAEDWIESWPGNQAYKQKLHWIICGVNQVAKVVSVMLIGCDHSFINANNPRQPYL